MINISSTIALSCQIDGFPIPNITWLKNNQTIASSHYTTYSNGTSTIIINSVRVSDSGKYNCKGENSYGVIYTSTTNVTILCKLIDNSKS